MSKNKLGNLLSGAVLGLSCPKRSIEAAKNKYQYKFSGLSVVCFLVLIEL
ncbi:hypothetical protein Murru_0960 [Allomuricauda ruestringensis DSM 13258]|uniref:Uncharacterized protein n=1 Tax=Allomuricauda ruestringensis (strain DSM 13258 / CIP 107369 / LMG 19739 / B1) TaxID=886377 RepID=G2PLH5_ALLRU|nr:hypothetical protein Murru_0960 [Allomuricauda ruestringensis DSM 13258]